METSLSQGQAGRFTTRRNASKSVFTITALTLGFLLGCDRGSRRQLNIELASEIEQQLVGVTARMGRWEHRVEFLTPDSPAIYSGWPYQLTDVAITVWSLEGVRRTNKVDLRGVVPDGVSGTLVFTFQRDTVKVSWRNDPGGE